MTELARSGMSRARVPLAPPANLYDRALGLFRTRPSKYQREAAPLGVPDNEAVRLRIGLQGDARAVALPVQTIRFADDRVSRPPASR